MTKKFFGIVFIAIVLCIGFASCSSDDDKEVDITTDNLLGTWRATYEEGWWIEDGEKTNYTSDDWEDWDDYIMTVQLNEDGSGIYTEEAKDSDYKSTGEFDWEIQGKNKIRLSRYVYNFINPTIVKLSSDTMILEETEEYEEGDEYIKVTFKRVK
ncbi:MAG: hypothetical protein LUF85_07520 [Bacteroides sp.]|nr:hypothetical protein [Bacteroides sp.]